MESAGRLPEARKNDIGFWGNYRRMWDVGLRDDGVGLRVQPMVSYLIGGFWGVVVLEVRV